MWSILVAEDDALQRKAIVGALANVANAKVVEADNGRAAQEILQNQDIDVAIADLMMPHVSGLDPIAWSKDTSPQTVWVMLSSADSFKNSVAAIRLGAFDFLAKPVDLFKLEATTHSAL